MIKLIKNGLIWLFVTGFFIIVAQSLWETPVLNAEESSMEMDVIQVTVETPVYAQPIDLSKEIGTLQTGQLAIRLNTLTNSWIKIYYAGQIGYVHTTDFVAYEGANGSYKELSKDKLHDIQVIFGLGDSIVYGDGLKTQDAAFLNLLGKKMQAVKTVNYGLNGSALAGYNVDRLLDRYMDMEKDADIIFVMGGTNDYGYGVELGTLGDKTDKTFFGGLNLLMSGLKQLYPDSTVIFLTPIKRKSGDKANALGYTLEEYANAVIEMGSFYGIQVIDLYHEKKLDYTGQTKRYMPDGLHPNSKGHTLLANYLYEKINTNK